MLPAWMRLLGWHRLSTTTGHKPFWAWEPHQLLLPERHRATPALPTWECGGCLMEVEDAVHVTVSGRICVEMQAAEPVGGWVARKTAQGRGDDGRW